MDGPLATGSTTAGSTTGSTTTGGTDLFPSSSIRSRRPQRQVVATAVFSTSEAHRDAASGVGGTLTHHGAQHVPGRSRSPKHRHGRKAMRGTGGIFSSNVLHVHGSRRFQVHRWTRPQQKNPKRTVLGFLSGTTSKPNESVFSYGLSSGRNVIHIF